MRVSLAFEIPPPPAAAAGEHIDSSVDLDPNGHRIVASRGGWAALLRAETGETIAPLEGVGEASCAGGRSTSTIDVRQYL